MNELNLHQLRVFRSVLESGSITGAAERLLVSQPSVSAQIRSLEERFGVALLDRQRAGVAPTEAGKLLAQYAEQILALADELDLSIGDLQGLRTGRLRIGGSTTIGEYLLPNLLGRFRAAYPGVSLTVEISNTAEIVRRVRGRQLDLGFVGDEVNEPELAVEPVATDELVVVIARDHPLARATAPVPIGSLRGLPFVVREAGSATRRIGERYLAQQGVTIRPTIELGSNEAVKHAVMAGLGAALLSRHAVTAELQAGLLQVVPVIGFDCRRQFYAIQPAGARLTNAELAFLQLARSGARA